MVEELKKVKSGDPFSMPAGTFNAFIDAAQDFRNRQSNISSTLTPKFAQNGVIHVQNNTGGDLEIFGIVGLEGILIGPSDNLREFRNRFPLIGIKPTEVNHRGRFGIAVEPIQSGKIGRVLIDGVTPTKINVLNESPECIFVDIVEGNTGNLETMSFGSGTVLWREGGTGIQWAVVRVGKRPILFPVELELAGGEQGTDLTPATWLYTAKDFLTQKPFPMPPIIDPVAAPHKWQRPSVGWMIEANFGIAYMNENNELVLTWINEMVDQEKCEEEGE